MNYQQIPGGRKGNAQMPSPAAGISGSPLQRAVQLAVARAPQMQVPQQARFMPAPQAQKVPQPQYTNTGFTGPGGVPPQVLAASLMKRF